MYFNNSLLFQSIKEDSLREREKINLYVIQYLKKLRSSFFRSTLFLIRVVIVVWADPEIIRVEAKLSNFIPDELQVFESKSRLRAHDHVVPVLIVETANQKGIIFVVCENNGDVFFLNEPSSQFLMYRVVGEVVCVHVCCARVNIPRLLNQGNVV